MKQSFKLWMQSIGDWKHNCYLLKPEITPVLHTSFLPFQLLASPLTLFPWSFLALESCASHWLSLKGFSAQDSSHPAPPCHRSSISGAQRELQLWWLASQILYSLWFPAPSMASCMPYSVFFFLPTSCQGQMQASFQNICLKRPSRS